MLQLFHTSSEQCSRVVTERYSTSFASAIQMLHKDLRAPICNIYGFVRFADEIVDTFHDFDKPTLLREFRQETFEAIRRGISLNPILNSFQLTVNQYNIDHVLIEAFFGSMEKDLTCQSYCAEGYNEYIYGSAEAVGLMCLTVFCEGRAEMMEKLRTSARSLGAAFQKVNFLRDMRSDYTGLSRLYFPRCDFNNFREEDKKQIEDDIQKDFRAAYKGIMDLPLKARFGVYVAYKYYFSLFCKIRRLQPSKMMEKRIRIPNYHKLLIFLRAGIKNQFRLIAPEHSEQWKARPGL
jgi:15-cis-phytoene synthase